MSGNLESQLRQRKDEALLRREPDEEMDRKIAELERLLQEKYAHTKKDKWHRVKESQ